MWPRKVSQEGSSEFCPPGSAGRESFEPRLCRFGCGTPRTIFENATSDMPPIEKVSSIRSEEHTSELQSLTNLVCRLLLEKKKTTKTLVNVVHRKRPLAARPKTPRRPRGA